MGIKNFKSKINDQAWLDWLSNDPPAPGAKEELRERHVRQANNYQPRLLRPPEPPKTEAKPAAPATVSIQIHIPAVNTDKLRRIKQAALERWRWLREWAVAQYRTNKRRSIAVTALVALVIIGVFVPPLLNFGNDKANTGRSGSAGGNNAGGSTGYAKPPFQVVVPSTKPQLANPDGRKSAYDGTRNTYSFSDAISGNGFIVSQQPIPTKFSGGQDAVDKIAPTLGDPSPDEFTTLFGQAYVATNPKTAAQTVIFSVRDVLLFIQSSHKFTSSQWTAYINALQ